MVKANKLVSGRRNRLPIYVLKLNKPEKVEEGQELSWLRGYQYVFPKELTNLPPKRELDHEIELILGAQPIA